MIDFKKLCKPHIEKAIKCRKEIVLKLEKELQANGFFEVMPKVTSYRDLFETLYSTPELKDLFLSAALKSEPDTHRCDVAVINSKGKVLQPESSYVSDTEFNFQYSSKDKPIECELVVSVLNHNNNIISTISENALFEMLNRHGFEIPLFELPNYSNEVLAKMFDF